MTTVADPSPILKIITPLRHDQVIGGESGVAFYIGDSLLFMPYNDRRLFLMNDPSLLMMAGRGGLMHDEVAAALIAQEIEPRLLAMAQDLEALL